MNSSPNWIMSARSVFRGIRFRELSISVVLADEESPVGRDVAWKGTVHLPKRKKFFAEISGSGRRFRAEPSDCLMLNIPALGESQFVPREWKVRTDARHAKSKTFRR